MSDLNALCESIKQLAELPNAGELYSDSLSATLKGIDHAQEGVVKYLADAVRRSGAVNDIGVLWTGVCSLPYRSMLAVRNPDDSESAVDPANFCRNLQGLVACARAAHAIRHCGNYLNLLDEAFRVYNPGAAKGNPQITDLPGGEFSQGTAYCSARRREPGPYLINPMQDCLDALLDQPQSQVLMSFTQPVVYVSDRGYTAALDVTLLKDGHGHQYADPLTTGLMLWTQEFQESIETAWNLATKSAADEGLEYRSFDVRWQLRGQLRRESEKLVSLLPHFLDGRSLGVALGVAFTQILRQSPLDPRCVITGALNADSSVTDVGDVYKKTFAALMTTPADCEDSNRHPIVRVIVPKENKTEALRAAQEVKWSYKDAVKPVGYLREACERSSGLLTEVLAYLKATEDRASELPAYFPHPLRENPAGFDSIQQTVQVIEDRSAYNDWLAREREESRSAGFDADNQERLAYSPHRSRPELDEGSHEHERPPAPVPWSADLLHRYPRMVILGDPGFGKSWCLRNLARQLAQKALHGLMTQEQTLDEVVLPIPFHLSQLSRSDGLVEDALKSIEILGMQPSEAFKDWLDTKLGQPGKCALFMDGWDEVDQDRLRQRLEVFAWNRAGTSMVMASRIVGYGSSPIPRAQELELVAWDQPQIEGFAWVWFGDEAAGPVLSQIKQNPQIQGLARIPLMLTLLCRGYRPGKALPNRRVDLYRQCFEGLLMYWREQDKRKRVNKAYLIGLLKVLRAVGFRLFLDGYERFSVETLYDMLVPVLSRLPRNHELHNKTPADVISELQETGVLVELGDSLGLLHRTFHEYLAACHLATLVNKKGWSAATVFMPHQKRRVLVSQLLDHKAWLPTWFQVIILLTGMLDDPGPVLQMLADRKKDDALRHRLVLAAKCLSEVDGPSNCEHLSSISTSIVSLYFVSTTPCRAHRGPRYDESLLLDAYLIVARLNCPVKTDNLPTGLRTWCYQSGFDRNGSPRLLEVMARGLCRMPVKRWFLANLCQIGTRMNRTHDLDDALRHLLESPEAEVRHLAACALGLNSLESNVEEVIRILKSADLQDESNLGDPLRHKLSGNGRSYLWTALPEAALRALPYLSVSVKRELPRQLAIHGLRDRRALTVLLNLLQDPAPAVRSSAAVMLGSFRQVDPSAVCILETLLEDPDPKVRRDVAVALGFLHHADPRAAEVLLAVLRDSPSDVTGDVVIALLRTGYSSDSQVLSALVNLLHNESWSSYLAHELAHTDMAPGNDLITALLSVFQHAGRNWRRQLDAALALGSMGHVIGSEMVERLLALLRDPQLKNHWAEIAQVLRRLGLSERSQSIDTALSLLQVTDGRLRGCVARMLPWLPVRNARVVAAVLRLLEDPLLRQEAAQALVKTGALAQSAVAARITEYLRRALFGKESIPYDLLVFREAGIRFFRNGRASKDWIIRNADELAVI